jgi:hypothetical protein
MLFTVKSRVFNERIAFTDASAAARLVAWSDSRGHLSGGADLVKFALAM